MWGANERTQMTRTHIGRRHTPARCYRPFRRHATIHKNGKAKPKPQQKKHTQKQKQAAEPETLLHHAPKMLQSGSGIITTMHTPLRDSLRTGVMWWCLVPGPAVCQTCCLTDCCIRIGTGFVFLEMLAGTEKELKKMPLPMFAIGVRFIWCVSKDDHRYLRGLGCSSATRTDGSKTRHCLIGEWD